MALLEETIYSNAAARLKGGVLNFVDKFLSLRSKI